MKNWYLWLILTLALPVQAGGGAVPDAEEFRRMVAELHSFYMVDLICDPELIPFYQRLGLHPSAGMAHRNTETLKGPC